ncbi:MAG: hypothetical protein ACKO0W_04085 [Planctomycetota bacterium]
MRAMPVAMAAIVCALVAREGCGQSYLGLQAVDHADGLLVMRVLPGPLEGEIFSSPTISRGDFLVSIDGEPATQESLAAVARRAPGAEVRIAYREGAARSAPYRLDPNGPLHEVVVAVEPQDDWRGTHGSADLPPLVALPLAGDVPRDDFARGLAALGPAARARADAIAAALAKLPERDRDPTTPPLLRAMFAAPGDTEALARAAIPPAADFAASPFRGAARLAAALAGDASAELPAAHGTFKVEHIDAAVWYLDFLLNHARVEMAQRIAPERAALPALGLLGVERLERLVVTGPNARASFKALQSLADFGPVDAARILAHFDVELAATVDWNAAPAEPLPEELAGAVEGAILGASNIPDLGWVVVGAPGANAYDLGRIAAVFDAGGNDVYRWSHAAGARRLVVDLAGNDRHESRGGVGAAGALAGISVIDDRAGDDVYDLGDLGGACVLGVAAIVDRAGDDRYRGGAWSLGAAMGGAAMVIDLGGSDRFDGEGMSIGVGGPRGVGAVVDLAGDDVAELGTRPSVYGVAGERSGFGMGFGLGLRTAAAGGVGAYIDFAGRDLRRSGEFSQGCGYYYGVGLLVDAGGDDVAVCDRYGLGSAAHQAVGVYIDLGGNDSYAARTAAHLGGAWDESLAVFVDSSGHDSYRADALALGSTSQQALAIAVDRAGDDQYRLGALGPPTYGLGATGTNEYHFARTGLGSFAVFLDLGGWDLYPGFAPLAPGARANDATVVSPEQAEPSHARADGVFIDERSGPTR